MPGFRIDVDGPDAASRYGVDSTFVMLVFSGGEEVGRVGGASPGGRTEAAIDGDLPGAPA